MILKASRRGGAKQLAQHLMNGEHNEHVCVHEVRGFMTDNLGRALNEIYAHSRANHKIKKFLFSMSINPPKGVTASQTDIVSAADKAEKLLGLTDQPRVIVFHEKEGRRHAHAVWSRVDENVKAIKLDYFKRKLTDLSRDLYIQHGWDLPKGLQNKQTRDRTSYDLSEYQAAKRHKLNPKEIKARLQACWHASVDLNSFKQAALKEGYALAKGTKRSFVLVDSYGEVRSLSRTLSVKVKEVKAKLGESNNLPSVDEAKASFMQSQKNELSRKQEVLAQHHDAQLSPLKKQISTLVETQRKERETLNTFHESRQLQERQARQAQYQKGLKGLWHFVTGRYHKQKQRHEEEYKTNLKRDTKEKETLIQNQLKARETLQHSLDELRTRQQSERLDITALNAQPIQDIAVSRHDTPKLGDKLEHGFEI